MGGKEVKNEGGRLAKTLAFISASKAIFAGLNSTKSFVNVLMNWCLIKSFEKVKSFG